MANDPIVPCPLCGEPTTPLVAMRQHGNDDVFALCGNCGEPVILHPDGSLERATGLHTGLLTAADLLSLRKQRQLIRARKAQHAPLP